MEVLACDDLALGVRDAAIVDEHDEEFENDVHHHDAVARIGSPPQRVPDRVEGHRHKRYKAVGDDCHGNEYLPQFVCKAATYTQSPVAKKNLSFMSLKYG